jgi:type I restriction enzyme M protein
LRANTSLTSKEYSRPVLGLIFLRYAEYRFEMATAKLADKSAGRKRSAGLKTVVSRYRRHQVTAK